MGPVKALSVMQPWTWLLANRHKPIENRDWRCHYRGRVLLHAGKKVDRDAMRELRAGFHPVTGERLEIEFPDEFETGGIVGEAVVVDCVDRSDSSWFVGKFGIVMRDAKPLPFRPCKGALGFFVPEFAPSPQTAREAGR
ncbi:ASCH domain-containing protein [Methylobacterium brachythecii]|uniref:ASCH domain-containing protein n=1 Tax=Methylobacterium brachythecii TaxID=1176177 RepID=A0A7W6ALC9_9HYPH|nr:ASCH domain-containing protein [Methylobacterium brachythecii]MBB3905588.1 hypothetical protein [Methylobacterium brachythecii]GLS46577.1 hypothetical protein GCM10007884_45710 [Methylobacterium brachythecii]